MSPKLILFTTAAIGVVVATTIGLRALSNKNPYSAHYRHTAQTQVTIQLVTAALMSYRSQYGSLPAGDNAAIFRQLAGDNPEKTVFLVSPKVYNSSAWPPEFAVDTEKRIVDGWNTPLRFRFGEASRVESAGEDRQFDTSDDLSESIPSR